MKSNPMQVIKEMVGGRTSFISLRPEVPCHTAPVIKREYSEDGKRFYETSEGKIYEADVYDKVFKAPGGRVKSKKQVRAIRNHSRSFKRI